MFPTVVWAMTTGTRVVDDDDDDDDSLHHGPFTTLEKQAAAHARMDNSHYIKSDWE